MVLRPGTLVIAQRIQEAADDLGASDVRSRLQDAVHDAHRGTGKYGYYQDHFGDADSGDVVYTSDGDIMRAPYDMAAGGDGAAKKAVVHTDAAQKVHPRTVYEPDCDEDGHVAAMESAKLYAGGIPLYERFISKSERDGADASDFAGKGKSFPILKPEDIGAAVHAMGRAGSGNLGPSGIKARIIAIAKRKGWTSSLPSSWQDGGTDKPKESAVASKEDATLVESCAAAEVLRISEAAGELNPLVKIISPGRGSTGYYTEALLKRDGPQIFKRGTLMYINHATNAEEAARPEGDWSKLAAVTTGDAYWDANGKDGPALYAPSKVFSHVAAEVREKAPYTGVSIRAAGLYAEAATGKPKRGLAMAESAMAPDGKPGLIGQLTRADSIDLVTKAGRDGKLLLESAVNLNEGGNVDMTEAEVKKLQESVATLQADNRKFKERAAVADAAGVVAEYFGTVQVPDGIKERVTKRVLAGTIPLTEAGDLDAAKLKTFVEAETKDEAAYIEKLTGRKVVTGMGTADATVVTEAQRKEQEAIAVRESDDFARMMGHGNDKTPGGLIIREGRSRFDLDYNAGKRDGITSGVTSEGVN